MQMCHVEWKNYANEELKNMNEFPMLMAMTSLVRNSPLLSSFITMTCKWCQSSTQCPRTQIKHIGTKQIPPQELCHCVLIIRVICVMIKIFIY